jgi:hypothetical protein
MKVPGFTHMYRRMCLRSSLRLGSYSEAIHSAALLLNPQVLRRLYSADPGGQFWAEQAGIRSLIRKPSNCREPSVNGSGRELPGR